MTIDNLEDHQYLQTLKDSIRGNLNRYTDRAFAALPEAEFSHILDIGCGSGVPTLELARLCPAKIVAIDNDKSQLEQLDKKLAEGGLKGRIETLCCSVDDMKFEDESFDIIWSEGSIYAVGFEKGLRQWRRFLKPVGYMSIHDERGNIKRKLKLINDCGYRLLDHFILDRDIWWKEYYSPLERELRKLQKARNKAAGIPDEFRKGLQEIEFFKKHPERCESVFFVITKQDRFRK